MAERDQTSPLLDVRDLVVAYGRGTSALRAVDGVSLSILRGESVGLVGESGCGKSTLGRTLLQLEKPAAGRIAMDGVETSRHRGKALFDFRRRIQMVFQDPFGSLNPRLTVGGMLEEVLRVHGIREATRRQERMHELMMAVGLDPQYLFRYPHEFSGGQRQRIGIARALAVQPDLVVADEPVSALDVSVQVQILNLFRDLRARLGLTYLFIAHDLAVVRYVCDRVLVMYAGRLVEEGPVNEVFRRPAHPYTKLLVESVPDIDVGLEARSRAPKTMTNRELPMRTRAGCAFVPRCPNADAVCRERAPALADGGSARRVACYHPEQRAVTP